MLMSAGPQGSKQVLKLAKRSNMHSMASMNSHKPALRKYFFDRTSYLGTVSKTLETSAIWIEVLDDLGI